MVVKYQITFMENEEITGVNQDEITETELEALITFMENEEITGVNQDEITETELEALLNEVEEAPQPKVVTEENETEKLRNKVAMLQRILNKKKAEPIIKDNEIQKDIAEIKFYRKVEVFAEENGLNKKQAEQVLKLYPNATAETLKDPFIKAGIDALARKERVAENTPRGSSTKSTTSSKSYGQMTPEEKKEWYANRMGK